MGFRVVVIIIKQIISAHRQFFSNLYVTYLFTVTSVFSVPTA